jgi:hypothetical protein
VDSSRWAVVEPIRSLSAIEGEPLFRTALHVTLTPLVFLFGAFLIAARLAPIGAAAVMLGALVLGVVAGWRNRHS